MQNKLLSDLKNDRPTLSISRPSSRISWGVKVPDEPDQTVYVWLDALMNYLTILGFHDMDLEDESQMLALEDNIKAFTHFIGKDITKFHCIHWPSFLLALFRSKLCKSKHVVEYPLPRLVYNHYHWLRDNKKMSKSLGNVVDPKELL